MSCLELLTNEWWDSGIDLDSARIISVVAGAKRSTSLKVTQFKGQIPVARREL